MSTTTATLESIKFDEGGFMVDAGQWTPEVAAMIALQEGIDLTERHWKVIEFARREFEVTGDAPTLRKITKESGVDTKEMYQLFPKGPAKLAAKIAGLKKPTGCI